MFSKWRIAGIDGYVFGEDGNLYRLPFESGNKCYGLRKIKMQHPNRWLINGEMWSKDQLRHKLIKEENPIHLTQQEDLPF